MATLHQFISSGTISQADLARVIGRHRSAVHKKLKGDRPWLLREMHAILAHLQKHSAEPLSLDDLFPAPKRSRRRVAA